MTKGEMYVAYRLMGKNDTEARAESELARSRPHHLRMVVLGKRYVRYGQDSLSDERVRLEKEVQRKERELVSLRRSIGAINAVMYLKSGTFNG